MVEGDANAARRTIVRDVQHRYARARLKSTFHSLLAVAHEGVAREHTEEVDHVAAVAKLCARVMFIVYIQISLGLSVTCGVRSRMNRSMLADR